MEDSIELPDSDIQNQQINFFVSPNNSLKKPKLQLINTGSQQSLAYSSQTLAKYQNSQRSPIQIQIPNFQSSQKPQKLRKMLRAGKLQNQKSPILKTTQSDNQLMIEGLTQQQHIHRQQRRKTVNKNNQYANLSKKYKQLQYAMHLQVINSQELRTKVSILSELLEQKIKQGEFNYFLKLKNSSKNLKNIDIFIELKQCQKRLKQTQLIVQQQKHQIQRLNDLSRIRSANKQNMDTSNSDPATQIQALIQQKQSLFNYIQQLRKEYNQKNRHTEELTKQLQRYQQKQQKFVTIERPKLILQISENKQQIKQLEQEVQKIRMQKNLMELTYQNQIQEIKNQIHNKSLGRKTQYTTQGTMTVQNLCKQVMIQTDFDDKSQQILKAQLKILKSQRDYYIQQFKKKMNESSQNYLLKLQIKAYQDSQRPDIFQNLIS